MVRLQRDGASAFPRLVKDIRRYMAVAGIALDISSSPVCIRPLGQAMLDREVIHAYCQCCQKVIPTWNAI
jgi:hypothetical protein